eukprot:506100-Amorphochlora_amoeboformis.AAC.2
MQPSCATWTHASRPARIYLAFFFCDAAPRKSFLVASFLRMIARALRRISRLASERSPYVEPPWSAELATSDHHRFTTYIVCWTPLYISCAQLTRAASKSIRHVW